MAKSASESRKLFCQLDAIKLDSNSDGIFSYTDVIDLVIKLYQFPAKWMSQNLAGISLGNFIELQPNSCNALNVSIRQPIHSILLGGYPFVEFPALE